MNPYEELIERFEALEARRLTLRDLPVAALQRKLEYDWQPDGSVLLLPQSIGTETLADDSVTDAKLAPYFPGRIIDTQRLAGANSAHKAVTTGQALTINAAGTIPLQLSFTPPVDCWWRVHMHNGQQKKIDAAYHSGYNQIVLVPNDVDGVGVSVVTGTQTQHTSVQTFMMYDMERTFKLAANTAYTATGYFAASGGTWSYFQGSDYLFIEGMAWAR